MSGKKEGGDEEEELGDGGGLQGDLCLRLGFTKVTTGSPRNAKASHPLSAHRLPTCSHAYAHLSLSVNGFPRFLMTA